MPAQVTGTLASQALWGRAQPLLEPLKQIEYWNSENIQSERLPQAQHTLNSYDRSSLAELPFDEDTYVVIATREHRIDQELLEFCLHQH